VYLKICGASKKSGFERTNSIWNVVASLAMRLMIGARLSENSNPDQMATLSSQLRLIEDRSPHCPDCLNAIMYFVGLESHAGTSNNPEGHAAVINRWRLSQPEPTLTGPLSTGGRHHADQLPQG